MSKFENLFTILPNGGIDLNKQELRGHTIFGGLLSDKTKSKQEKLQIMMYIYLMADGRSIYHHLGEDEKEVKVKKHIGLDDFWQATPQIKAGVDYYKELVAISPTGKAFSSASRALYEIGQDTNEMLDNIIFFKDLLRKKMLEIKQAKDLGDNEKNELVTASNNLMKEIITNQKDITKQIKDLPPLIKTVEELAMKWANEGNGSREIYGGGALGNRE